MSATVRITNGGSHGSIGTGTIIATNSTERYALVLTCRHVVPAAGPCRIRLVSGVEYDGVWIGCDERSDLAALAFVYQGVEPTVLPLAEVPARAGEPLAQAGFESGGGPVFRHGACKGGVDPRSIKRSDGIPPGTAPGPAASYIGRPGASGAGMVRLSDLSVVGVFWGSSDEAGDSIGVPLCDCQRFVSERCLRWFPGCGSRRSVVQRPVPPNVPVPPAVPVPAVPVPGLPEPQPTPPAAPVADVRAIIREEITAALAQLPKPATGPAGPAGPQGLQGVKGDTGPVGPAGPAADVSALEARLAILEGRALPPNQRVRVVPAQP